MIFEEYKNGKITVDYMKGKVDSRITNKIHCHDFCELMIVVSGDINYADKGGVLKVSERGLVFTRAHEVHNPCVDSSRIYERYKISFSAHLFRQVFKEENVASELISQSYKKNLSENDFEEILFCFKGIFEEMKHNKSSDMSVAAYLIHALLRGQSAISTTSYAEDNYVLSVIDYINQNYRERLTIEGVAAQFFVSRGKLIYDFKAYAGMSISEYVSLMRIEAAKNMLLSGYSVSAAAEKCGFSSSSYFIKVFSAITDMTPLKFQIIFSKKSLDKPKQTGYNTNS